MTDRARTEPSGPLTVHSTVRAGSLHVALAGELDMAAAFRLESELERLLETPAIDDVVLDLAAIKFLDSAGLGALLSIREQATRLGRDVRIAQMSDPVRRVLDASATRNVLGG